MAQTINWYGPFNTTERLKRTFSLLNLVFLTAVAVLLFSELRFNWCEQITGAYLASCNENRPETGTAWQAGKSNSRARTHLKSIVNDRQTAARNASEASTFAELSSGILPGQWANLDKDHFKQLYLDLPDAYARELIHPTDLVWLFGTEDVNRIFCKSRSNGLAIFFLDSRNRVIRKVLVDNDRLAFFEKQERPLDQRLDTLPQFTSRIFPARRFFKVLQELPGDINEDLIVDPSKLIRQEGTIVRAGISGEAESGYIRMGFEFLHNGETTTVLVKGREWAVWRLTMSLTGEKP